MAETIKELLVSIGFGVDDRSEKKFENSIRRATLQAELLSKALIETAKNVAQALESVAKNFDALYWTSQRTGASVQNIRALSYAVSQLGGTYQGAMASIEAFGQKLRSNPGYESMVRGLGVQTRDARGQLRDQITVMEELGGRLKKMPYYIANQYAGALGIDENTLRALQSGDIQKYLKQYEEIQKAAGLDPDKAARASQQFQTQIRALQQTIEAVAAKALTDYMPKISEWLEKFQKWVVDHGPEITAAFEKIATTVAQVATDMVELAKQLEPVWDGFVKIAEAITGREGLVAAIEVLVGAAVLGKLVSMLSVLVGTGGNMGGLMGRFLGFLAPVALAMGIAGYGSSQILSDPEKAAAATPEANRARIDERRGAIRKLWGRAKSALGMGEETYPPVGKVKPLSSSQRDQNALDMYRTIRQAGLPPAAAIGILANVQQESNFNPAARGDGGKAAGYFQHWPARRAAILRGTGIDMANPKLSGGDAARGMLWEMQHSNDAGARRAYRILQNITSPEEAAKVFSQHYERPLRTEHEKAIRARNASAWKQRINDEIANSGPKAANGPAFNAAHPAFLGGQSPLMTTGGSSVNMSQNTNINVVGSTNPVDTANAIEKKQDGVNSRMFRNTQGAFR